VRILVLNYEYPPLGGGAGNATYFLCREWAKGGHTVDIVTTWFAGCDEVAPGPDNVTVYRVKSRRRRVDRSNPLEMMSYVSHGLRKATQLVKSNTYDFAVSFFAIPTGVIAYRLLKKHGLPYIVLLRGGDVPGFLHGELGLFHAVTMPFTRPVWRHAGRIIANSKSLQRLATMTADRLHRGVDMVPNGVDVDFFQPAPTRPPPPPQGPFTFIFSGRFVPQKNLFCLLDQFESLAAGREKEATHPFAERSGALRLILVGDGPEKPGLEKRITSSPSLSKSVMLYPWSSKEALRDLYRASHCFVNPSFEEGMPNTLLEAMACGLPAIASDVGGNSELVENGKNGFLFDIRDPSDLGKSMQKIMRAFDINSMGTFSRTRARRGFSWAASASKILEHSL
jgi:glycosyltransferase involved in cell wall biosynthesis